MSLGEMQACIARLCIDDGFRERFISEPVRSLGGYVLSEGERRAVSAIDPVALQAFARSLEAKRRARVGFAYPLLFGIAQADAIRYFSRFHQLQRAHPKRPDAHEIVDFGSFVEETAAVGEERTRYLADVARYERLSFCVSLEKTSEPLGAEQAIAPDVRPLLRPGCRIAAFDCDVAGIEKAWRRGELAAPFAPERKPNALVFIAAADGDAKRLPINAQTKAILQLCDGKRTVAEIVAASEAALGLEHAAAGVTEKLRRSVALKILQT